MIETFCETLEEWEVRFDTIPSSTLKFFFDLKNLCNTLEDHPEKRLFSIPKLLTTHKSLWKDIVAFNRSDGWYSVQNWWERMFKRLTRMQEEMFYFDDF